MDVKEMEVINTLVFETLGNPEREREFKLKSLKDWGFDLIFGKIDGKEGYFTCEINTKKVNDKYDKDGKNYEVLEVLENLPNNAELYAHIEMEQGTAYIVCNLRLDDKDTCILRTPAGLLLMSYLRKHKFGNIIKYIKNIGISSEIIISNGAGGSPYSYQELPNEIRRFLRSARKIEKETNFGRLAIAYYGETKDKKDRCLISWLLPTICLFDSDIAKKADNTLGMIKV